MLYAEEGLIWGINECHDSGRVLDFDLRIRRDGLTTFFDAQGAIESRTDPEMRRLDGWAEVLAADESYKRWRPILERERFEFSGVIQLPVSLYSMIERVLWLERTGSAGAKQARVDAHRALVPAFLSAIGDLLPQYRFAPSQVL